MKIKDIKKPTDEDKSLATNAWYSNNVTRPISYYLTKPFISLEPTTICFIMILLGLASLPFFLIGEYWSIIVGALVLQVHYIFDHIDGNVARATNKKTKRGQYLDYIPNITVNPLVFVALGYGFFKTTGNLNFLLFGFSAGFFYLAKDPARLFKYLMFFERNILSKNKANRNQSILSKFNRHSSIILDYPGIMNILLIFAILNISQFLLFFYGIVLPLFFIARVTYEFYSMKKRGDK
jgi:phosphatidylserine synthase